jgi:two-component system nitrogen regulation sensor histidine kinase NtrY
MSFRKRLLLLFALTIALVVALSSSVVWVMLRRSFERANEERAEGLTAQFRGEFARRGEEVARRVGAVASGEAVGRIALELNRGEADRGLYVDTAGELAAGQHLDFLELIDDQGVIVSSAQWPAKFGYKKTDVVWSAGPGAFLRREEVADGVQLGLFSMRAVQVGEKPLYVLGGQTLGSGFLASLELPPGLRVLLYPNVEHDYAATRLVDARGPVKDGERLGELMRIVQTSGQEAGGVVEWTGDGADAESFRALPLTGGAGAKPELLGVLLVGSARRPLVELQRRVVSASLLVGGVGLLVAILLSSWLATRVSQPLVALADGARRVAAGDWETRVPVASRDELGELAEAFNRMTGELRMQRDHLIQAERVAAWRELARRLAHELKNPLFPLQVTVENLVRARGLATAEFDEVFQESTGTLLAELGNLNAIIGRFSEFSRMPQPQRSLVSVNEVVQGVERLHAAQLSAAGVAVDALLGDVPQVSADPELLHRALSNLVLNAADAMPAGGKLGLATRAWADGVEIAVSDTGTGMSKEEAERLFTPYYTTKQHGTGLGLAIVQSVVSDHGGNVGVESSVKGTTFKIRLPRGVS